MEKLKRETIWSATISIWRNLKFKVLDDDWLKNVISNFENIIKDINYKSDIIDDLKKEVYELKKELINLRLTNFNLNK
jgi:hypothetical protein